MASKCPYDPRDMADQPLGMYHCPLCGEMCVAGMDHPDYDLLPEDLDPWRRAWFDLLCWLCRAGPTANDTLEDVVTYMRARAKEIKCRTKDT